MHRLQLASIGLISLVLLGAGCGGPKAPTRVVFQRPAVDCSYFTQKKPDGKVEPDVQKLIDDYLAGYKAGGRGYIPKNFVDVADRSNLCGAIADESSAYSYLHSATFYLSPLSTDELFAFFKRELAKRGCTVEPLLKQPGAVGEFMPFTCKDGHGQIVPYPDAEAYAINFDLNK